MEYVHFAEKLFRALNMKNIVTISDSVDTEHGVIEYVHVITSTSDYYMSKGNGAASFIYRTMDDMKCSANHLARIPNTSNCCLKRAIDRMERQLRAGKLRELVH